MQNFTFCKKTPKNTHKPLNRNVIANVKHCKKLQKMQNFAKFATFCNRFTFSKAIRISGLNAKISIFLQNVKFLHTTGENHEQFTEYD